VLRYHDGGRVLRYDGGRCNGIMVIECDSRVVL
jgi:hypothetical protein